VSLTFHSVLRKLYTEPSKGASYHISVLLVTRFQRRSFVRNQPSRNKNFPCRPCFLSNQNEMSNLYRGPSIDVSYQVSFHLGQRFQRRRLFLIDQTGNNNCLWWPCLLTVRDEMSNLYREPSMHADYQVSFHLPKRLQRKRFFRNRPIRKKNCLWQPCLLPDRDKISNLYRGPSIDAYYPVSIYLAKRFQRRRLKYEKLTDDGR